MSDAARKALYRRLWSNVRHLPGGEEAMRDMVGVIRNRDGTGENLSAAEYVSVRKLTLGQLKRLIAMVEEKMHWPERRRCMDGNVEWLVSPQERSYVQFLRKSLGWGPEAFTAFVERQIKQTKITTHKQASAVIEPMERMLAEKGWTLTERKGRKWWDRPEEKEGECGTSST